MENRLALINSVLKHFLNDLKLSIQPFTEVNDLIYFAETLLGYLDGIYNTVPVNEYFETVDFDEAEYIRVKLLSRFRDKMVPFVRTSLKHYFAKDEFNKLQLFRKLKITEPVLNDEEYEVYINCIHHFITLWLERLYLLPVKGTLSSDISELPQIGAEPPKGKNANYTRSRQLLLFYFFTKASGLDRQEVSIRTLAQFAHYLFNYPNDNIDNSEVYKQLKKAPYLKADSFLLKDLDFVKAQFELLGHSEAVRLVQKEINAIKKN